MLLLAISTTSCRKAIEKAANNIRIEKIESIERRGFTGADIVIRVMNDTGHKLSLETAELRLFYDSTLVGTAVLFEPIEVPQRATTSVQTRWKLKISDPIALLATTAKMGQKDYTPFGISFDIKGKGGPMPIKISQEMIPLSDFLRTFGVQIDDLLK